MSNNLLVAEQDMETATLEQNAQPSFVEQTEKSPAPEQITSSGPQQQVCNIGSIGEDTINALLDQLAPENRGTIEELIKRAIARQDEELPVSPLLLAHDGLKLTVEGGKQILDNILFSDRPSIEETNKDAELIQLPEPVEQPSEQFETLMCRRKSIRDYSSEPVSLAEIASICFSTAGPRSRFKSNTNQVIPYAPKSPTGGGLLSVYLYYIALNTTGLARGIYKYRADKHALQLECEGELRGRLYEVTSLQDWVVSSAGIFVMVSDLDRIMWKYEDSAYRLTHMDAGVLVQSLHLAATSIDLGSCLVFGFLDDDMNQLMGIDGDRQFVSLIMPIGKPIARFNVS